jgi:hypothetical protein
MEVDSQKEQNKRKTSRLAVYILNGSVGLDF